MVKNFKPKNNIQKLAYDKRGVVKVTEFEGLITKEPWKVARTTARYWWDNGIKMPTLPNLLKLSDFFDVTVDELIKQKDGVK